MTRTFETHVDGLGFPEGPVALPDGSIAFVDLLHAKVRAWKDGEIRESRLVFIGRNLDEEILKTGFEACLA